MNHISYAIKDDDYVCPKSIFPKDDTSVIISEKLYTKIYRQIDTNDINGPFVGQLKKEKDDLIQGQKLNDFLTYNKYGTFKNHKNLQEKLYSKSFLSFVKLRYDRLSSKPYLKLFANEFDKGRESGVGLFDSLITLE